MVRLNPKEYVFLLGAGASVGCGLPTTNEMTTRLIKAVDDPADPALFRTLCLVLGGIQFLRGQQGVIPNASFNVEEVAETLEALRLRRTSNLSPFVGAWNELLCLYDGSGNRSRDCLGELNKLLREKIAEWLITPEPDKIKYFDKLKEFVGDTSPVEVFTLNYDGCVEAALKGANSRFTCGFDQNGWNSALFANSELEVCLYKLHGSLDWYRDEEDQAIYSLLTPPEGRVPAADPPPLLIFGTTNKLWPTDPFLFLSHTFSERTKAANVFIIIGYGFGDDYVNQILLQGLSQDSRKRLLIVGKDSNSAENTFRRSMPQAENFLQANRVQFLDGDAKAGFENGTIFNRLKENLAEATDVGPF